MKISEVKYGKKFNCGNYESEEYVVTAIVDEDESASEVFLALKVEVTTAHSGILATEQTTDEGKTEDEVIEDRPARGPKQGKGKSPKSDDSETEEEIEGEEEGGEETEEETEVGNEPEEEETPGKKGKTLKGKSKPSTDGADKVGGKKFKKKPQVYQRSNETHKEIFTGILYAVSPNWKKDDKLKAKAKATSMKLEGEEFLDEDGDVLESFKQATKKSMGAKK